MEVKLGDHDQVVTKVHTNEGANLELSADFVIDATGLEADIREHRVLADLLDHGGAGRNPLDRLDVERTFEVRGTRSEPGRLYAVGSATLGGYFAGVDTFLGLQYAAQQVCDDLARQSFCRRIGFGRSISQWWKWALNTKVA
jgi:lysine/ornithine N-monooxygenase